MYSQPLKKFVFMFLLAALCLQGSALRPEDFTADTLQQRPWSERFRQGLDSMIQFEDLCQCSAAGIYFYDLTADTVMYDFGSRQMLRPASVMKTLTAATALTQLGCQYQYETHLCMSGAIEDSVLRGNLYVKAGFDPCFDADDMRGFVAALRQAGISAIEGDIVADLSFKDTITVGEGWIWHWRADEHPLTPLLFNSRDCFMARFFQALDENNIRRPGGYSLGLMPKDGTALLATCSRNIDQVLVRMLKESDNLYAESMFYQLGAQEGVPFADYRRSRKYVEKFIRNCLDEDPDLYTIADGCGLSVYDCLSPRLIVKMLRYIYHNESLFAHFYPALPVAGEDGTLAGRMKNTTAQGNVHAKTGTVARVITLAGYARTAQGHDVAFALMHNGIHSSREARAWDDRVLQLLTMP